MVKTIGMVRVCCSSAAVVGVLWVMAMSGFDAMSACAEFSDLVNAGRPTKVELDIAALGPTKLLQRSPERRQDCFIAGIVFGEAHQQADAAHTL